MLSHSVRRKITQITFAVHSTLSINEVNIDPVIELDQCNKKDTLGHITIISILDYKLSMRKGVDQNRFIYLLVI